MGLTPGPHFGSNIVTLFKKAECVISCVMILLTKICFPLPTFPQMVRSQMPLAPRTRKAGCETASGEEGLDRDHGPDLPDLPQ